MKHMENSDYRQYLEQKFSNLETMIQGLSNNHDREISRIENKIADMDKKIDGIEIKQVALITKISIFGTVAVMIVSAVINILFDII